MKQTFWMFPDFLINWESCHPCLVYTLYSNVEQKKKLKVWTSLAFQVSFAMALFFWYFLATESDSTNKAKKETNGGDGYRSHYLSHAKRALYHLSYTPLMSDPLWDYIWNIFLLQFSGPMRNQKETNTLILRIFNCWRNITIQIVGLKEPKNYLSFLFVKAVWCTDLSPPTLWTLPLRLQIPWEKTGRCPFALLAVAKNVAPNQSCTRSVLNRCLCVCWKILKKLFTRHITFNLFVCLFAKVPERWQGWPHSPFHTWICRLQLWHTMCHAGHRAFWSAGSCSRP